jgi:hypothetical protein
LVAGFFVDLVLLALAPLLASADDEVAFFIPRANLHFRSRKRKNSYIVAFVDLIISWYLGWVEMSKLQSRG